jgi:hypothetical protein
MACILKDQMAIILRRTPELQIGTDRTKLEDDHYSEALFLSDFGIVASMSPGVLVPRHRQLPESVSTRSVNFKARSFWEGHFLKSPRQKSRKPLKNFKGFSSVSRRMLGSHRISEA